MTQSLISVLFFDAIISCMYEEIVKNKSLDEVKLLNYGFKKDKEFFILSRNILDEQFLLMIKVFFDGCIDSNLYTIDSGEEYFLYKTDSSGVFVGQVREAVKEVISDIIVNCYYTDVFKYSQTKRVIAYVNNKYSDKLEYLWEKFPDNAIWRRSDNKKWYAAILTTTKDKFGFNTKEKVEIIDLRIQLEQIETILSKSNYYPGWHMNKKHWYTIILDDSVPDEEIFEGIDLSYNLAR